MNAFNYTDHDNHRRARTKGFRAVGRSVRRGARRTLFTGWMRGNPGQGWRHPIARTGTLLQTMTIMRAASALCLLLLSGCAAGAQRTHDAILRPRPKVLYINGTFEPVAFVLRDKVAMAPKQREACETNDPMPTGHFPEPATQMLTARPLRVAPMPNACPVTVPLTGKSVVASTPLEPKTVPAPAPTEPQP